jgi:hypothetical protein
MVHQNHADACVCEDNEGSFRIHVALAEKKALWERRRYVVRLVSKRESNAPIDIVGYDYVISGWLVQVVESRHSVFEP